MGTGMAVGLSGLLFGLKKTQVVSAVYLGNGVSLVRREVMGMWYVQVPCNSDVLLRAAMICEEKNVKSSWSKDKSLLYYSSPSLTCQTIYCFCHFKMWPVEDDGAGPSCCAHRCAGPPCSSVSWGEPSSPALHPAALWAEATPLFVTGLPQNCPPRHAGGMGCGAG